MIVSWNTTNQCNMFCDHCYRESGPKAKAELTTDEARRMIKDIAAAGFRIMIFSGGEPLMRPDILELIAYAASLKLRPVLGTNGYFITLDMARKLKEAGVMGAGISLDSLDAAKHDQLRHLQGAWSMAVQGMRNCRAAGLPFQVHTTVMDWNEPELEAITDFAVKEGAVAHHIFFLVPTGRGEKIVEHSLPRQAYENVLQRIMRKAATVNIEVKPTCAPQFMRVAEQLGIKQRFTKGCIAGTAYCIISPSGDVQPCAYMNMKLGNVRDIPFGKIWQHNEVLQRLRTTAYTGLCGGCAYKDTCGGCRARAAYYNEGDYMAADPICILQEASGEA